MAGLPSLGQRAIVASSGAPAKALDARSGPPNIQNPSILRVTMDSGFLGLNVEERWSAFQFTLLSPASFDGIEINYQEKLGSIPLTYGWSIYSDSGGKPGALIDSGTGLYALLALGATGVTYANAFFVDKVATVPIDEQDLPAGVYWASVYGVDGNLPQFSGAPGGSKNNFASRKTSTGSLYTNFETKSFAMPNYGQILTAGYDGMGSSAPYNYSHWAPNEQQGRDLYHIAYSLVDSSGSTGTVVTGQIAVDNWVGPISQYFQDDPSKLQAFDIYFTNLATGATQIVQTVNVDSTGLFTTEKIANGTYDIAVYTRHWYIGRFSCTVNGTTYQQQNVTGFGHPFVGYTKTGVTLTGGTLNLGAVVLYDGDADLSATIDLIDLNSVLVAFASNIYDGCPPNWDSYFFCTDCDGDGLIGLLDLNAVLINFGLVGPAR